MTGHLATQMVRMGLVSMILYKKPLPLDSVNLAGKMGRVWWMEKFLQLIVLPRLKIPKSVSFEDSDLSENQHPDTERHSTVAGLQVKVLEKDTDGTIRQVKVTHTESE